MLAPLRIGRNLRQVELVFELRPSPFVDHVRLSLDRYAKESPMIDERRWAKLEHEFHLSKVPPDPQWGEHKIRIPEPSSDD